MIAATKDSWACFEDIVDDFYVVLLVHESELDIKKILILIVYTQNAKYAQITQ